MRTWKKIVVVNGGGLVGIVISLFIVPEQTPIWLWAAVSVTAIAVLNYVFFYWRRAAIDNAEANRGAKTTIIIALGVVILLLDLILRYHRR